MKTSYRVLWTVAVEHEFRGGACDDLAFVVPAATREALAGMRALARERDGVLHVLLAVDDDGEPLGECAGRRLVFGLAPRDPSFAAYTAPYPLAPGEVPLFGNEATPDALDPAPRGVELAGPEPRLVPRLAARPVELRVASPAGGVLATGRLDATQGTWTFRGAAGPAEYAVEESAAGGLAAIRRLFVEPTLAADPTWGLLALTATPGHVEDGCAFTLSLAARTDRLRYYVVVRPLSEADLASIDVHYNAGAGDLPGPLEFDRVLPPFGEGRLDAALLDPGGTRRVVLFEARSPVARRARGPRGVELHRGGEVLVGNLPQPGASPGDAQFVLHLGKP